MNRSRESAQQADGRRSSLVDQGPSPPSLLGQYPRVGVLDGAQGRIEVLGQEPGPTVKDSRPVPVRRSDPPSLVAVLKELTGPLDEEGTAHALRESGSDLLGFGIAQHRAMMKGGGVGGGPGAIASSMKTKKLPPLSKDDYADLVIGRYVGLRMRQAARLIRKGQRSRVTIASVRREGCGVIFYIAGPDMLRAR